MKYSKSITNYVILFLILLLLGILYRRFEDKRLREESLYDTNAIQKYLLDDITLAKSKKPILWIHVPYEYNSRKWLSFGSRSSFDLNQPYLYLTVKSILNQCDHSFTICLIDDTSFEKLIPGWEIDMKKISDPILENMRTLGLMKLLYIYGGMICPISFLCIKNLIGLYNRGTNGNKMFICEVADQNITSTEYNFYPSLTFCGAPKECETVRRLIDFIQRTISGDFTAQSVFLGDFDRWCESRVRKGYINLIPGTEIGTKTVNERNIGIEELLGQNYLDIYPQTYGILIPSKQILKRLHYEWFARLSERQVLESNTIIGNYILVTLGEGGRKILEPLETKPNWVGFWRTPLYTGLYMVSQPNYLGNNLIKQNYTGR